MPFSRLGGVFLLFQMVELKILPGSCKAPGTDWSLGYTDSKPLSREAVVELAGLVTRFQLLPRFPDFVCPSIREPDHLIRQPL